MMSGAPKSREAAAGSPDLPHFPDVGVIGLVPEAWGGSWQLRHHFLTRLAVYFNVVWVDPARGWRESLASPAPRPDGDGALPAGFSVYRPEMWLPQLYRPRFAGRLTFRGRLRGARRILKRRGARTTVLYLWRPDYDESLDLIEHAFSCYHIDDEYTFSSVEKPIDPREAALIARVNQVYITSPALLKKKGSLNPSTVVVPNGVDYRAYTTPQGEPSDLGAIPHPRIGYVGTIKAQLDLRLLTDLARRHRDWSFVFIGPTGYLGDDAPLIEALSHMPNVYFLGARPVGELPAYTQHLDVCMLCYVVDDYTKFIYPLKLHEYLASGRPVVGAPIRSLEEFADVVRIGRTAEEWSSAIAESLSGAARSAQQVESRRRVARDYAWDKLTHRVAATITGGLGQPYRDRFARLRGQGEGSRT